MVLPAGKEIERALLVSAQRHPNITFYEHHLATDLVVDEVAGTLHCFGADVLDQRAHTMTRFIGYSTMLASGGAGQVRHQEATQCGLGPEAGRCRNWACAPVTT